MLRTVATSSEPVSTQGPVLYARKGHVGLITLNRPAAGNAIDQETVAALSEICRAINQDPEVRVALVSGAGDKAFCLGEDTAILSGGAGEPPSPDSLTEFGLRRNVAEVVSGIECPVIAAVNGDALGAGLALALACDLRIASARASFGIGDTARDCLLANGLTQLLPRIVGRGKAMEMLLTADPITASEALDIGLVHRVLPPEKVAAEAERVAAEMATRAPIALRYAKEAVNKGMDLTLEQALRLECDLYMILHTTGDRTEGITAFRDKKKPTFKGE
jgi:enoyl-CoA hydratase/carnithine racemase